MQIGIDSRPLEGERAGIGNYVSGLLAGLSQIDKENHYLLFTRKPINLDLAPNFQIKVIPSTPLWHLQVSDYVRTHQLIFHATHSLIDANLVGIRGVLTVHDLTSLTEQDKHTLKVKAISHLLFKRALRKIQQLITPTQVVRNDLLAYLPEVKDKVTVIHEAVEENFGEVVSKDVLKLYDLESGYIFFNATLEPRKNVPRLLLAYSQLEKKPPLVLAGKKGWGFGEVEKEISRLNLKKDVRVLGWVKDEDLASLYQFASVLVYPSLNEGFGLSPLKAFKVGVPAVVSDLPVFSEVVGEAALKVDPYNVSALKQALEKVLNDQVLRKMLIQKGFDQVAKYTWKETARKTLEIYQKVQDAIS